MIFELEIEKFSKTCKKRAFIKYELEYFQEYETLHHSMNPETVSTVDSLLLKLLGVSTITLGPGSPPKPALVYRVPNSITMGGFSDVIPNPAKNDIFSLLKVTHKGKSERGK